MYDRIAASKSGPYVSRVLHLVQPLIPEELQNSLDDYLKRLNELIERGETENEIERQTNQAIDEVGQRIKEQLRGDP